MTLSKFSRRLFKLPICNIYITFILLISLPCLVTSLVLFGGKVVSSYSFFVIVELNHPKDFCPRSDRNRCSLPLSYLQKETGLIWWSSRHQKWFPQKKVARTSEKVFLWTIFCSRILWFYSRALHRSLWYRCYQNKGKNWREWTWKWSTWTLQRLPRLLRRTCFRNGNLSQIVSKSCLPTCLAWIAVS